jgi:hypothetical protein
MLAWLIPPPPAPPKPPPRAANRWRLAESGTSLATIVRDSRCVKEGRRDEESLIVQHWPALSRHRQGVPKSLAEMAALAAAHLPSGVHVGRRPGVRGAPKASSFFSSAGSSTSTT